MLYYKVKKEADQKYKNPLIHDCNIYVADELYTPGEVKRQNLNIKYLEPVQVSKRAIYWFFGCRFAG